MSAQVARLARGTLVYGLGALLNRTLAFLLLPLFTRLLTPEDYGVSAVIGTVLVALGGVFSLGTGNSMGLLYFETRDPSARPTVVWTTVVLLAANAIVLCPVGIALAAPLSELLFHTPVYTDFIRMAIMTTALLTVSDPFFAYLRMEEKAGKVVILSALDAGLTAGFSIYFVAILGRGLRGMFESSLLVKALMFLIVLGAIGWRLRPRVDLGLVAPLVRIGCPSIFGLGAFLVVDYIDRLILQQMTSIEVVGVYSVGYNFGMIMLLGVGAFGIAWPPYFMSFIGRREDAQVAFGKVLKYYLAVFGTLSMVFFAAARPVLALMTAGPFHPAYSVVGLVALAYMFKGCYLILLPGIYFEKKLYLQTLIEWAAALLNILLNLALIPRLGMDGAALATCLAYASLPICAYFAGRRYLAVHYEWSRLGALGGGLGVAALALAWISAPPPSLTQLGLSLLALLGFGLFLTLAVLGQGERQKGIRLLSTALRS
jgi:O-antigen/teichoic acid export membrane protein